MAFSIVRLFEKCYNVYFSHLSSWWAEDLLHSQIWCFYSVILVSGSFLIIQRLVLVLALTRSVVFVWTCRYKVLTLDWIGLLSFAGNVFSHSVQPGKQKDCIVVYSIQNLNRNMHTLHPIHLHITHYMHLVVLFGYCTGFKFLLNLTFFQAIVPYQWPDGSSMKWSSVG